MHDAKLVVIGGGTGSFALLSQFKHYFSDITAVVNMADDGGSTGKLRDELGVLPPGDVRQCLVALSRSPDSLRRLFNYRFEEGSLAGHSLGNLFLTAAEKSTQNFAEAVKIAGRVLNISGKVLPMTLDDVTLMMEQTDGTITKGEFRISDSDFGNHIRPRIFLSPQATINPDAKRAIEEADMIVVAPGNLYNSLAPALVVQGVAEAWKKSKAKKVYVCNLVTKPGQTDNFTVQDFAAEIERFLNGGKLDFVLYDATSPSTELLDKYAKSGEYWVAFNEHRPKNTHYTAVGGHLISGAFAPVASKGDPIAHARTLIRHDADAVANILLNILER